MQKIESIVLNQREFFNSNHTKSEEFRMSCLKKLREAILAYEGRILQALKGDLNKAEFEGYMSEVGMVLEDLNYAIKHLPAWMKRRPVRTPLAQFYAKSFVVAEPYGVVLIMSPWNYPFQLCIEPLIGAIAAGNTAVIKPSAYAPATSQVIADLIAEYFPANYLQVVQGGRKENADLLAERFDYIFFTGGETVGKLVMQAASKHLTPISLELGGKSPCIVDETADLPLAAKRLAFGKVLNSGQTCVAPDYLLIQEKIKEEFLCELEKSISTFFPQGALNDVNWPKIINHKHFDRLLNLLRGESIRIGGKSNLETLQIEPTVLDNISAGSPVMQEEIFGPILPVLTYGTVEEAIKFVKLRPKPLALYLFSQNEQVQERVLNELSFGGGCINDTIIHLATPHMGFGGVGESGMGSYHGKLSFDTFTHYKSIVKKANWMDLEVRYHPYTHKKEKMLRRFMK